MSIINIINSVVPRETSQVLQLTHLLEKCVAKEVRLKYKAVRPGFRQKKSLSLTPCLQLRVTVDYGNT